jgi:major membrane immunogen (membrane-anchored lipoprotein)
MKLALVGSLVAASLLVGCNESGMSASKRPDVAPYMGADNGFMVKGWKPGDQASWSAEITKRNQSQSEYSRIK